MEATIYQRVKLVLEDKSISVNALSKQINVAQATLNPQLRGDRTLAANIVAKILDVFPDVSAEWLMRGVGTMYSNQDVQYSLSLDNIGGSHCFSILSSCLFLTSTHFWYDVEFQKLIGSLAILVDVQIDTLVSVGKFLESDSDRFFFDCFLPSHKPLFYNSAAKISIFFVTRKFWVTK